MSLGSGFGSSGSVYGYKAPAPALSPYGSQGAKNTTVYPTNESTLPAITAPKPNIPSTVTGTVAVPQLGGTYSSGGTTGTPAPTKTVGTPAVSPTTTSVYDYTTDPILQQVQAAAAQAKADAQSNALASTEALAIQYGDPALAATTGDANTETGSTDANDPYSVYGQLDSQQPIDENNLDNTLNQHNLYYSGARINQQGQLATSYNVQRAQDAGNEQQAYAGIQNDMATADANADQSVLSAESDAYNRYLQTMLASLTATPTSTSTGGSVPNGSSDGGTFDPIFTALSDVPTGATATSLQKTVATPTSAGLYPADNTVPVAIALAGGKAGSANKKQGVFAVN